MNLILEKTDQVKFFTNMKEIFIALRIHCRDYDWYASDIETSGYAVKEGWYSGFEFEKVISENDIQFIWAVFSAVLKGSRSEVADAPYVEGNPDYWNASNPTPQLAGAMFEIACWDSSATILVGIDSTMAENFKSAYTDTVELEYAAR